MLADPKIQSIITELQNWPWQVISSHKSAGQPFHKLTFLADLGVRADDPGINVILERILENQSTEGAFQLPVNVPAHFGGTGEDQLGWALCDAPLLLYALAKMGLGYDPRVQKAAGYLAGLVRENGWPCTVSKSLGNFRGPGRKEDPCPFATLAMLKALGVIEELARFRCLPHRYGNPAASLVDQPQRSPLYLLHGNRFPQAQGAVHLVRPASCAGGFIVLFLGEE